MESDVVVLCFEDEQEEGCIYRSRAGELSPIAEDYERDCNISDQYLIKGSS